MYRNTVIALLLILSHLSASAENWMSRLDDSLPIGAISIPGTHDAGTGNGFTAEFAPLAEQFATTQDCTIGEQFRSGIRAFDMRPAVVKENDKTRLHIFHGVMKTTLNFEDAVYELIDSLKANPTEFIIIVMRHETDGDGGSKEWSNVMKSFLNKNGVKEHIANYSPMLTVGDMRGKMLVLSRKDYADTPRGGFIHHWTSDEDLNEQKSAVIKGRHSEGRLYVQDYYETIGEKMDIKIECIKRMIDEAQNLPLDNPRPLVINHTSGYSAVGYIGEVEAATTDGYRHNASVTNAATIKMLKKSRGPAGIIMMDFAATNKSGKYKVRGLELTKAIIKQNFK